MLLGPPFLTNVLHTKLKVLSACLYHVHHLGIERVIDGGRLLAPRNNTVVDIGLILHLFLEVDPYLPCLLPQQVSHDPSPSPSPSPRVVGRKRSRSPKRSLSPSEPFVKAQKVSEGGGRPKASDYDEVAKEVILHATAIYRCLVSTSNAFPTPSEEGEMIKAAWNRANDETLQEVPIALTPVIAKVVSCI